MDDFRVPLGFFRHPKTVKLKRRLGADGVLAFLQLWDFCSQPGSRTDGSLRGMDFEDIAIAAGLDGDGEDLVMALQEVGFLDGEPGTLSIHDWDQFQPFVSTHNERSKAARDAANMRWARHGHADDEEEHEEEMLTACATHAPRMPDACDEHQTAMPNDANGNAPYPSPSPLPSPLPFPDPKKEEQNIARAEQAKAIPGNVTTTEELTEYVAKAGWQTVLSPNQVVVATRVLDVAPMTAQELAYAASVTIDRAKAQGSRPSVGLFLSIVKGERSRAPKPGSEHEAAERAAQERAPPRKIYKPPSEEPAFVRPGVVAAEILAKIGVG